MSLANLIKNLCNRPARRATVHELAPIVPNRWGGWSIVHPSLGLRIGSYDSPQRAASVALINGWDSTVEDRGNPT